MKPSGVIYKTKSKSSGELKVSLSEKQKKRMKRFQWLGANFASFAIAALLFFYGPGFLADLDYITQYARIRNANQVQAAEEEVKITSSKTVTVPTPTPTPKPKEKKLIEEFSISIPAIGAYADVIENVNPYNKDKYLEALKEGVAHAEGTGFPGGGKRVYLFAHSTNSPLNFAQYNAVFYQLRLLKTGDLVIANFNGDSINYRVTKKEIVDATDTSWLKESTNTESLVLQTCDPPGTTLRRLLVIAKPV